jgi:type IV pilus assembly protein PilV
VPMKSTTGEKAMHRMRQSKAVRSGRSQRGFMLIEAMVGILIFSFGVLGLVGLQAAMTKAQTSAKTRADASYLANEIVGSMWLDAANLANYATATCASHTRCNALKTKVEAALPNGAADIEILGGGGVRITITWTSPNEGTHRFVTETAIQT